MKLSKKQARLRRATKFRAKHASSDLHRLCVHKTINHIYAQIVTSTGDSTIVAASSVSAKLTNGGNIAAASEIGTKIAQAAKEAGIEAVAFDRGGFKYHGRVKALAESAREAGLKF